MNCRGALALALILAGCQTASVSFTNSKFSPDDSVRVEGIWGLLARPQGNGPFPAVVILHTCGGMTPHVTIDWPGYLTGLGYVTLSVDSLGPRGHKICTEMAVREMQQASDAYGALDYLATLPYVDVQRVAVMGFSMGAVTINNILVRRFRKSSERDFKAAIALYGHCNGLNYEPGDIPVMEIVAEHDWLHTLTCVAVGKRSPVEVHVIPGAYHSFDSITSSGGYDPSGTYMQYSAQATSKARELTKAFLGRTLGRPGVADER